jgi:hypothetical protein
MSDMLEECHAAKIRLQGSVSSPVSKRHSVNVRGRGAVLTFAIAACALAGIAADRAWALAAPTYYSGTVTAAITVTFKVAPVAGSTVSCGLSLVSNDARGPSESGSITAAVSGSQAICNMSIHYKWALTTPTADTMRIVWSVQGPAQYSSATYDVITMPATGSATGPLNIPVSQ